MAEHDYNLRPSLQWVARPDERVSVHPFAATTLPRRFVFGEDDPIDDQLQLGSCTANAMDEVIWAIMEELGVAPFHISRLWQYYQERLREGTVSIDNGATIADTVWVAKNLGFFPETLYGYDISKFNQAPPANLLNEAGKYKGVIDTMMMQTDVATSKVAMYNGDGLKPRPLIYGFAVYQQYESIGAYGAIMPPSGNALGGHANTKYGWDDDIYFTGWPGPGGWRVHNVWGPGWGQAGKAWLPYNYPLWDHWQVSPVLLPTPTPSVVKYADKITVNLSISEIHYPDGKVQSGAGGTLVFIPK